MVTHLQIAVVIPYYRLRDNNFEVSEGIGLIVSKICIVDDA